MVLEAKKVGDLWRVIDTETGRPARRVSERPVDDGGYVRESNAIVKANAINADEAQERKKLAAPFALAAQKALGKFTRKTGASPGPDPALDRRPLPDVDPNEICAEAVHEVDRAFGKALGDTGPGWNEAMDWQMADARTIVPLALSAQTPEASHNAWVQHRQTAGWKKGDAFDPGAKTDPNMVPFGELAPGPLTRHKLRHDTARAVSTALKSYSFYGPAGADTPGNQA